MLQIHRQYICFELYRKLTSSIGLGKIVRWNITDDSPWLLIFKILVYDVIKCWGSIRKLCAIYKNHWYLIDINYVLYFSIFETLPIDLMYKNGKFQFYIHLLSINDIIFVKPLHSMKHFYLCCLCNKVAGIFNIKLFIAIWLNIKWGHVKLDNCTNGMTIKQNGSVHHFALKCLF